MGGVSTVWTGSAFDCPNALDEIALLHNRFKSGYFETYWLLCTNGAIVGHSISVVGNLYTSQFNVSVTPDAAGKTVMCFSDNGATSTLIFSLVIPLTG